MSLRATFISSEAEHQAPCERIWPENGTALDIPNDCRPDFEQVGMEVVVADENGNVVYTGEITAMLERPPADSNTDSDADRRYYCHGRWKQNTRKSILGRAVEA